MSQKRTQMLSAIEQIIKDGSIDDLKQLINQMPPDKKCFELPNLVILACKNKRLEALKYLLTIEGEALENNQRIAKLSNDIDDCQHNAFYYALLSGNTELLNTLVTNLLDDATSPSNVEELDAILSKTYEEFKLKNIPLSHDIRVYVETKLINLRFLSADNAELPLLSNKTDQRSLAAAADIKARIEFLVENIALLNTDYSNEQKIDEKFLFLAKFIAQNIYVLKQQLKSTYKVLPWEEIEFCLISFISPHVKKDKINDLFYHFTLDKKKVLKYLDIFSKKLQEEAAKNLEDVEIQIQDLNELPMINRDLAVEYIIRLCPEFEELYNDHQQIRDIHSLSKMYEYIELSLAFNDPKKEEGQLVINRALTVIGEHMRNTLDSPKLSKAIQDFLLFQLSNNTKRIITEIRDLLKHKFFFPTTTTTDDAAFIEFHEDLKKLGDSIADILNKSRIEIMRKLLKAIVDDVDDSLAPIREKTKTLMHSIMFDEMHLESFRLIDHRSIAVLLEEIQTSIIKPTVYEEVIFIKINDVILSELKLNVMTRFNYIDACHAFILFNAFEGEATTCQITEIKNWAKQLLKALTPDEAENTKFKSISELSFEIYDSLKPRTQDDKIKMKELNDRIFGINFIAYLTTSDVKFKKELHQKMCARFSEIETKKQGHSDTNTTNEHYLEELNLKFDELKNMLENNTSPKPKHRNPNVEVLLLDILNILNNSKICLFENNFMSVNANAHLLIGEHLRNHLAHGNALVDLLLQDPSTSIYANANKLVEEEETIIAGNKKIGKKVQEILTKIKDNYEWRLMIVTNQQNMFTALQNGNFFEYLCCLEKGADVHAKCSKMRTALHYASIGGNLGLVKNVFEQNVSADAKDVHSKTALHLAAEYGRTDVVEYLLEKKIVFVDETTELEETALHLAAAKGHKETVEILLKHNAQTDKQNVFKLFTIIGLIPLQIAALNHHKDVVEILLKQENHPENINKLNLMYLAAKSCDLDMVKYLHKKKAKVNGNISMPDVSPLHLAARNGNLALVNALIEMKANVNLENIEVFVPLHFAIINGHDNIVETLMIHGADIDHMDYDQITPLHYAIQNGHEKIVELLLNNGAKPDLYNAGGSTPFNYAVNLGNMNIINSLIKHGVKIDSRDNLKLTILHRLILHGWNKEVAELLLKHKANVNTKAHLKRTPLHLAAMTGDTDFVEFLIKNGADVNARDEDNETPLYKAASNPNLDIIKMLVTNKALINVENSGQCSPLFRAAYCGFAEIIEYLLENNAQEDKQKKLKYMAINAAITWGHADVLKVLLKYRSQINDSGMEDGTATYAAVDAGHKNILEILIANGANINPKGMGDATPLCCAIRRNRKEIIEVLVSSGAKAEGESGEPMFMAASYGFNDSLKYLLEKKARFKTKGENSGENLLISAVLKGHKDVVNTLVGNGIDVNASYFNGQFEVSVLHLAIMKEQNEIVKILVDNGANINAKNSHLGAPLRYAIAQNNFECLKFFINSGKVKVNTRDNFDYTLLHLASEKGNLEMVKYLVDKGSDKNAKMSKDDGSKAIHVAAKNGFEKIVEYLIEKGQKVDEWNSIKQTPLHLASLNNQMEVAKYLISKKADVNYKDKHGRTPLNCAYESNATDIVNLLLDNGADGAVIADQSKQVKANNIQKNHKKIDNSSSSAPSGSSASSAPSASSVNQAKLISKKIELITDAILPEPLENEHSEREYLHCEQVMLRDIVISGDEEFLKDLIGRGKDLNYVYSDGLPLLHSAVYNGRTNIVKILLANGANVGQVTNKGNTPLHTAVSKNNKELVDILLQHPSRCKLNEFIDVKTTNSGSTALHVAAKNNSLDIVISLLTYGAAYDITNQKGEVPCKVSNDRHVKSFLEMIAILFDLILIGDLEAISILKRLKPDEFLAATNARNSQGSTLLQVAIANKETDVTNQLLHIIKKHV